jgi:hypothetical protein
VGSGSGILRRTRSGRDEATMPAAWRASSGRGDTAIAQNVSRQRPRVRPKLRSCGICVGRSGTGTSSLRVFRFPLPILTPPTAPHYSGRRTPLKGRETDISAHRTGRQATDDNTTVKACHEDVWGSGGIDPRIINLTLDAPDTLLPRKHPPIQTG